MFYSPRIIRPALADPKNHSRTLRDSIRSAIARFVCHGGDTESDEHSATPPRQELIRRL